MRDKKGDDVKMKKISLVGLLSIVLFLVGAVQKSPNVIQPDPKETKKVPKVTVSVVKEVVVDTFEISNLWKGKTMEWKEGAVEETGEDTLKLTLNSEPKFVKTGKKSLKIEYVTATTGISKNKFARLNRNCEAPIGGNNAISFWVYVADGNATLSIEFFDDINWKKCSAKEIPLNLKGWKQIILTKKDFADPDNWSKVNIIQLILTGKVVLYLDDISFTKI